KKLLTMCRLRPQKDGKLSFLTMSNGGCLFRNRTYYYCCLTNCRKKELNMNKEKEREIIERFTENLNQKAKINELAVIGREEEMKQLIYILSRMVKNNPLLIGYPGVGKTALVEGLVQRIKQERVPDYLKGKVVYQLDIMSLMAGTKFQGELEER